MFELRQTQRLPITIDEAWNFFSNPGNLREITPPSLDFKITSPPPEKIYAGLIITYRVRPLFGIPLNWATEITHIEEPRYFVDVQRSGPYRMWQHRHHFLEISGGVEMSDIVHYLLPAGPLSPLVNRWIVKKELARIFEYRQEVLTQRFGKM